MLINSKPQNKMKPNNEYYMINKRTLNSGTNLNNLHNSVIPLVIYNNIETEKTSILKDNKGKTGIYRLTNLVNSKVYIGSANDLRIRFWVYFSNNRLISSNMTIYKAIIKYGYANFKLEILEYCNPNVLLIREQYYIDLLKPEYNILSTAGSTLGYKHTTDTLEKFKTRKISNKTLANLAEAAKGRVLSKEIRAKISKVRTGIKLSDETRAKLSAIGTAREGVAVEVTNITSCEINQYATLTQAAIALGVSRTAVKKAMDSGKVLKKNYLIKFNDKK